MVNHIEPRRAAEIMLDWLDLKLVAFNELQSLWAGYGHICALTARASSKQVAARVRNATGMTEANGGEDFQLVLKLISPPPATTSDEGHLRKMLSYEVEQVFYTEVAPRLGGDSPVAKCLASTLHRPEGVPPSPELDGLIATLITDLRPDFPVSGEKRSILTSPQVDASLRWLASFHRNSWELIPESRGEFLLPPLEESKRRESGPSKAGDKLWLNGGYTYLATRRKEYSNLAKLSRSEWSKAFCTAQHGSSLSIAEMAAQALTPRGRPMESYIHGDVKSENLFTTDSGNLVAFFDFQYVGLGLGTCDLAKLFTCSVPLEMLTSEYSIPDELSMTEGEMTLLKTYRETLLGRSPERGTLVEYPWDLFVRHWETALVDWCRFQASWGFWGNTEWLEARVRSILNDQGWQEWLQNDVMGTRAV
ncbi:phosphotransferase [Paramyrothecium foliicola]|nr:phosphotransferase [Paramyrothecium foliicola]